MRSATRLVSVIPARMRASQTRFSNRPSCIIWPTAMVAAPLLMPSTLMSAARIRVVALYSDSSAEGLPDSWRTTYFGSPSPGPGRHPGDDSDGDGYTNLQEWLLGSNPADPTSNLLITSFVPTNIQWQARGYEVYELCSSTNLTNWTRAINPIVPTNSV